ncbi:membrane protein insertase YidC [Coxiella endosymbiont of Amblyomma sculptum]|uniref:membrane protein insertase YidC n=1 Tax=Coxiella endosymbiont of Amblyomma sculptum TaxID=2487929 RepID=UPI00132F20F4|nr:membrane protein insertase YidC [Coxiella endosymbiont of Amblyomma sculptum]QHG92204.1 membrane protein insertase YidC [Coxiella endosymbiont of Amblyomma sculptum]
MDIKKTIVCIVVVFLAVAIFDDWMRDYPGTFKKNFESVSENSQSKEKALTRCVLSKPTTLQKIENVSSVSSLDQKNSFREIRQRKAHLITIRTDVLELIIDPQRGGAIISAKLLKYLDEKKRQPMQILSNNSKRLYIAQSGLINWKDKTPVVFCCPEQKDQYILDKNKNKIVVQLKNRTPKGVCIRKIYTVYRNDYAVRIDYLMHNSTKKPWKGSFCAQITQREPRVKHHHFYARSYSGVAISDSQTPYEKITYKDMQEKDIDRTSKGGWIAVQQHYFLSVWIPDSDLIYHYYSCILSSRIIGNTYTVGFISSPMNVGSGETTISCAKFYVGPKEVERLKTLAEPGLDRTIDYGWFWPISVLLFRLMRAIHFVVKNWGWTIVLTTTFIKIVFYWFSAQSFRSMIRIREIQPRLQELKKRYGKDRKSLGRATIALYRTEKINPLGGYLPMLIQIPVFIAFYYVIMESVELRQAPFVFWIHDLSSKDPYYILPILMGIGMLIQQKLSSVSLDPKQQRIMWIFPAICTTFFINFPSGLVLYWLINSFIQTLQQWFIHRTHTNRKEKLKILCNRKS